MEKKKYELIECESVSVRLTSGFFFDFPIVDNKGLFSHFYRTYEEFEHQIKCCLDTETYALYGRKENIAYLICAWKIKEEINESALNVISNSSKLNYLLK